MGYIEQNLMPAERVIYRASLHWATFVGPALVTGIGIILLPLTSLGGEDTAGAACFGWGLLLLGIASGLSAATMYFTTEFAVTDKRVIAKTGLLRRQSLELLLSKVESISVSQPIMGRIFNYGTITVTGTGGTKGLFKSIREPLELRRQVQTQIS